MNPHLGRISVDPEICGRTTVIAGTRIWVSLVLEFLADGMTEADRLIEYRQLTHPDVLAALAFGAEMSRARILAVPQDHVI